MRQVCRGLAVAHRESPPIVHRDIKPQNILVGYDGAGLRVRVSDFGLARGVNPLTLMATARGTLCFKAPEAVLNRNFDSLAGDVWALGCTLYLLLTDRFPYGDSDSDELAPDRIAKGPLILPSRLNVDADAALDQIVSRTLAIAVNDRLSNAAEMLMALEEWHPSSKPDPKRDLEQRANSSSSKESPSNGSSAKKKLAFALELARDPSRLSEAADVLEDALNGLPGLRDEYEYYLKLWRRGIAL
jgi:serine/threonine-protein kinase